MKRKNSYYISGNNVYMLVKNTTMSREVIIDLDDLQEVAKYNWRLNKDAYAVHSSVATKERFMHHLILKRKKGLETDHINRNRVDNRKANLRYATRKQNVENTGVRKDSLTKIKGVGYYKSIDRWCAKIQIRGKRMFLGSRKSPEEAEELYKNAVAKYRN